MSFRKFAAAAALVAGLQMAGTSAQSISSQCQSTLASIVTDSNASCLNAQALVGLVVSTSTSANSSVVPTINSWLTGMCSRPACTNDTLASVVQQVTSGCSAELGSLGLANVDAGELTTLVQTAYPTVRQVACLGDTSNNNSLCLTETLNNLEPYTGALSVSNIESLASQIMGGTVPNLPSNVTCTDCTKAAYNIVQQKFGDLTSGFSSDISSTCGASFTDGTQPASVTQLATDSTASTTTSSTSNAAAGMFSAPIGLAPLAGLAASSLLTAASAFFVLA
ncbi:hypothetical protein OH77DRAFT_1423864 [Trametes cingulata]|nr:hypothetical protein OH77DRAFT_1423864 [Trametes cingulata]